MDGSRNKGLMRGKVRDKVLVRDKKGRERDKVLWFVKLFSN